MNLERVIVGFNIFILALYVVFENFYAGTPHDYLRWFSVAGLVALNIYYLTKKNRVVIYSLLIIVLLLFPSSYWKYHIAGSGILIGLLYLIFTVLFIIATLYDGLRSGLREKVYCIVLTALIILGIIVRWNDILTYDQLERSSIAMVFVLIWPFFVNLKLHEDLNRVLILYALLLVRGFIF